jgi:hypothetical protein
MAQVGQHTLKPAKRTSRRKTSRHRGPGAFDLLLKDIFPLEPNEALQRLTALACHWPAMPVMKWRVKSKRWEILHLEAIGLSVEIDPATGADTLGIRDTRYSHPAFDEPVEFYARSTDTKDIERTELLESNNDLISDYGDYDPIAKFEREWKEQPRTPPRLYPAAAAPPRALSKEPTRRKPTPKKKRRKAKQPSHAAAPPSTVAAPAVSEVATQDVPQPAAGSRDQQQIMKFVAEEFPNGWENVETRDIIKRVGDKMTAMNLKVPGRDAFNRALGRRPK